MFTRHSIFEGSATAMVIPVNRYGDLDLDTFGRLLEWMIREGADVVVVNGITGGSATLDDKEKTVVIRYAIKQVDDRVPVIVGTGNNYMKHVVELSRKAQGLGVDTLLQVMPYYNKASQGGLARHFTQMADHVSILALLYSVSSRTRVTIQLEAYKILSGRPNIRGAKEANGSLSLIAKAAALYGEGFSIYSGNDNQTVPIMSLGDRKVVSMLTSIMPREIHQMCRLCLDGDVKESRWMQPEFLEIMEVLFWNVSPIPMKAAPCMIRVYGDDLRLSLTPVELEQGERLAEVMKRQGISLKKELHNRVSLPQ